MWMMMEILQYVLERHLTTSLTLILTQKQLRQQIMVRSVLYNAINYTLLKVLSLLTLAI